MKRILILACAAIFMLPSVKVNAQSNDCDLPLMVYMTNSQDEHFPRAAASHLSSKLHKIITENGLAASDGYAQFGLCANFTILGKSIVPGPPRSFIYELEMDIFVGDFVSKKIFASTGITIKGVGENETKAYINALKKVNPKSREIQDFIAASKDKVVKYYDDNYTTIIATAKSQAKQRQFSEAMFNLMSVPSCSKGYAATMKATEEVYQLYVDDMCNKYLNKAKMAWASQQNASGAEEAGEYLAYIYPDAKCYGEANMLYKEIKSKVREDWDFVMKIYDDSVSLEEQRIDAWREVGKEFGKNQQASTTHVYWAR